MEKPLRLCRRAGLFGELSRGSQQLTNRLRSPRRDDVARVCFRHVVVRPTTFASQGNNLRLWSTSTKPQESRRSEFDPDVARAACHPNGTKAPGVSSEALQPDNPLR